jgi:hemoglobin
LKKEIESYEDIALLVSYFYETVKANSVLSPFFAHLSDSDWEHHLPQITQFWSDILLGTQAYKGNPMTPHFSA